MALRGLSMEFQNEEEARKTIAKAQKAQLDCCESIYKEWGWASSQQEERSIKASM